MNCFCELMLNSSENIHVKGQAKWYKRGTAPLILWEVSVSTRPRFFIGLQVRIKS